MSLDSMPDKVRRCRHLMIEPREVSRVDAAAALAGHIAMTTDHEWVAWAPHLRERVRLTFLQLEALGGLPLGGWISWTELQEQRSAEVLCSLLEAGILIGDHAAHAELRDADEALRQANWWTPAAVAYAGGCWEGVDSTVPGPGQETRASLAALGPAPPSVSVRDTRSVGIDLAPSRAQALDTLLLRRATCRNFDADASISTDDLSQVLAQTFAARGQSEVVPGAFAMKKGSPSGGGLHPIEAFVLVQRVDGLPAGLYHYDCMKHRLAALAPEAPTDLRALALEFVAGQEWFADAAVLVVMVARFERNQWKYRNHPKAYRVTLLDAGHLGQTFALSATELGLGVFITGAINEHCITGRLGLRSGLEGAVAVCGVGPRAATTTHAELTAEGLVGA